LREEAWRDKVERIFGRRNRYQFGQPDQTTTLVGGGEVACTDTSIQMIVMLVKELNVSLNEVRRRSGAPFGQPMDSIEALRALHSFGLPYERRNDLNAMECMNIADNRGPVILCVSYWAYAQWEGYTYAGRTLHGYATSPAGRKVNVGVAKPEKRAGLTQWTFPDGHAVVEGCSKKIGRRRFGVLRDPNHNSVARPERPAYDLLTVQQMNRGLDAYERQYGHRVVLVPTRDIRR
jgi:hypothetical protein